MEESKTEILDLSTLDQEDNIQLKMGWDSAQIENAKIMVIGAGALGNEVLKNLALIGVRQVVIVDFDVIERTNLAKSVLYRERDCTGNKRKVAIATERLKDINPEMKVMQIDGDAILDIGLGVIRKMDVVIGCLDNRLTRLWINRHCFALGKPWVDGGILNLEGQVNVYIPNVNCYECGLGPKAWKIINYRNGCINRMKRYASAGLANTNSIVASVVGAIQVQEALKLVAEPKRTLAGKQFYFNGRTNYYDTLGNISPQRDNCRSHLPYTNIIEAPLSALQTVGEALEWLEGYFSDSKVSIRLQHPVVLEVGTEQSEKLKPFIKARPHITEELLDALREIPDEEVRFRKWTDIVDTGFPALETPLIEIGIPRYHILSVISKGKKAFVELSGDKHYLKFE